MSSESITLTDDLFFNELYIFANEINRGFVSGSLVVCESNDEEDTIILKLQDGFPGHDSNKYDKYIIYTLNDKRTLLINFQRLWKKGDFLKITYPREVSELLLTDKDLKGKINKLPEGPQTGVTPTIITLSKGRVVDVSTSEKEGDLYRLPTGDYIKIQGEIGQGKKVRVRRRSVISIKEIIEEPGDCTGKFYNSHNNTNVGHYSFPLSKIILPKIVSTDRTYLIKTNDNLTFTGKFENINTKKKVLHTSGNLFFYVKEQNVDRVDDAEPAPEEHQEENPEKDLEEQLEEEARKKAEEEREKEEEARRKSQEEEEDKSDDEVETVQDPDSKTDSETDSEPEQPEPEKPEPEKPEPEHPKSDKEKVKEAMRRIKYRKSIKDIKKEENWIYRFALSSLGLMIFGLIKEDNNYDIFKFIDNDFNTFEVLLNDIQNKNLKELLNKFYKIQIFSSNVEPTKILSYFLTGYHKILKVEEGITDEEYSINKLLEQLDKFQREYGMSLLNDNELTEETTNEMNFFLGGNKKRKKITKKRYKKLSTNLRIPKSIKKKKQIGGTDFNITKFIKYKPQKRELNSSEYIEEICHEYERSLGTVELQVTKINEDNKEYMCVSLNEKLIRMKNFFILKRKNPGKDRYCLVYTNKNNLTLGFYKIGAHNFFSGDLNGDGENNLIITQILDPRLRERFFFKIEFLEEHLGDDFYFTLFSKDQLEETEKEKLKSWEKEINAIPPYNVPSEEVPNKSYEFSSIRNFYDLLKFRRRREQSGGQIQEDLFSTRSVYNTDLHGLIPLENNLIKSKYRLKKIHLTEDREDLLSYKINETPFKQKKVTPKEGHILRVGVRGKKEHSLTPLELISSTLKRLGRYPKEKNTSKVISLGDQQTKMASKKKKGTVVTVDKKDYILDKDYIPDGFKGETSLKVIEAKPQTSYFSKPKGYSPLAQRYPESIEHTARFDGVFFWKLKEFDYFRFKYKNYQYLCLTTNYKTDKKRYISKKKNFDNCSEKRFYLKNFHSRFFCSPEVKETTKANSQRRMLGKNKVSQTFPTDFITTVNMTSNNRMGRDTSLNDVESDVLFREEIISRDITNIRQWLEREEREETLCKQKDKILEEIENWYSFEAIPKRFEKHVIDTSSSKHTLEKLRVQGKYDYNFRCLISLKTLDWTIMKSEIERLTKEFSEDDKKTKRQSLEKSIYVNLVRSLYKDGIYSFYRLGLQHKSTKIKDFLEIKKKNNDETSSLPVYYQEYSFEYFQSLYNNLNSSNTNELDFEGVINIVKSCLLLLNFPYIFINKHITELRVHKGNFTEPEKYTVYFFYIMGMFMSCKFFYGNDLDIKGEESPYLDIDLILNTLKIKDLFELDVQTRVTIHEVSLTPVIDNNEDKELNTFRLELYVPLAITDYLRERACKTTNEDTYKDHPNKEVLKVLLERKKKLQEEPKIS